MYNDISGQAIRILCNATDLHVFIWLKALLASINRIPSVSSSANRTLYNLQEGMDDNSLSTTFWSRWQFLLSIPFSLC